MLKSVLLLFTGLILFSCGVENQGNELTYWVNSYKVDCVGAGPMKCMLIQKGDKVVSGEWQNFYTQIEGFDYQAGYIYKLLVREEKLENVPADASSIKYTLVKLMEKNADPKLRINDIWVATSIAGEAISPEEGPWNGKRAQLEVNISEMRIMGNDGCNNYNADPGTGSHCRYSHDVYGYDCSRQIQHCTGPCQKVQTCCHGTGVA